MQKSIIKILVVFGVLFFSQFGIAQKRKLERAKKQYDRYEYINAQETYLKVADKGYKSADLFKNLGNSYYFNSQFKDASKWYKQLVDSYPNEIEAEYFFRYAQTLKSAGKYKDANVYMQKFSELNASDKRAELFKNEPDYLKRIDFQSDRYDIRKLAINSPFTDFGAAFFGNQVVFASSRDTLLVKKSIHQWTNESFLRLHKAEQDPLTGELSRVRKFDNKLNSKFHESTPVFTKDGKTVYFTRNNYDGKQRQGVKDINRLKVYRSFRKMNGDWTIPQSLSFNNDTYTVAHPALSPDEKTLYFSSDMPGGKGLSDLYEVAIHEDGTFGEPKNMGDRINTGGKETFPFVSASNDLYFSSNGYNGLGGLDVYVTKLDPQTEEEKLVVNIGKPVNGTKDDFAFVINDETNIGYFSSNRAKGKDDIYSVKQLEGLKSFCEITISGLVSDLDTKELIPGAKVSVLDSDNKLLKSFVVGDKAFYSQLVKCNSSYFVRGEKEGYITTEELVNTPGETQIIDTPLVLEKEVKTADVGDDLSKILSLKPIYFDFDQSYIRSDAAVELAKVVEIMNQYPQMKIDVRSHTDSHGDDNYNMMLSEKRAKSTVAFMVSNGIIASRLIGKGYGETQPVNKCANGSRCKKEEYQLNRRSEFIIIE